jgi:hypothetical protein
MNNLTWILLMILFVPLDAFGQGTSSAVSNVVTQVSEVRDKVTVTYDLARRPGVPSYTIVVRITLDGEVVSAQALSGDIGPNITPGYGKRIVWDVLKDLSELYGSLQIEVSAKSATPDCIPIKTVPVYAGLTGAGAAGLALILSGLKLESDSKELYDVYKINLNPNEAVFNELSREEHYQEANSKHKKGTWLSIGGGTVIVAGGVILVSRLIQIKKYNKDCGGRTTDAFQQWKVRPLVGVGSSINTVSAGIAVNF